MSRPDILNLPHIVAKLEKLQSVHTEHEAKMDRWNAEIQAQNKQEKANGKTRRKPRNASRRKQENLKAKARGQEPEASRGDGDEHEAGRQADEGRGVQEKKQVEPCEKCQGDKDCEGGPFCGCPCHDGNMRVAHG